MGAAAAAATNTKLVGTCTTAVATKASQQYRTYGQQLAELSGGLKLRVGIL